MDTIVFNNPRKLVFGPGCFEQFLEDLPEKGLKKVFILGIPVQRSFLAGKTESLISRGLEVERQKAVPIVYKGRHYDEGFRADLFVNDCVIVELKSVENVSAKHKKQLLTCLRLSKKRLGLLINFSEDMIKNGIYRIISGF